jgi:hypothetical protein
MDPCRFIAVSVTVAIAATLGGACLAASPGDETGQMLERAVKRARPTKQDQAVARDLLTDWVDQHPDDVYLKHAFIKISQGRPPGAEEMDALNRIHRRYTRARAEAEARAGGAGRGATAAKGPTRRRRGGWSERLGPLAAVAGMAAVVLLIGAGVIIVSRRRSA